MESGDQPRLGDGDRLLFHRLVDGRAVLLVHLVELIDQAQAAVRQHHRPTLQCPLPSGVVLLHRGRQSDPGGALTSGVHHTVEGLLHVLQHLGLGTAGVSQQQHVDVTAEPVALVPLLRDTTKHRHTQRRLRMLTPVNRRRDRPDDFRPDAPGGGQVVQPVKIRVADALQAGGRAVDNVVCLDDRVEHGEAVTNRGKSGVDDLVGPHHLNEIARLDLVHQISGENHLLRSWGTARGHRPRRFLQRDLLVVAVETVLPVHLEGTSRAALGAVPGLDVIVTVRDEERAQAVPTLDAIHIQLSEFREHQGPLGHHPHDMHDGIHVDPPKGSDLVLHREVH
mmetsp:Transcript_47990/g.117712  ORF Transcript_47990/g.117712 Transcript_47990/m.117712 type:complete len:337 (-) Transcript_47990:680-1690(-)